MNSAHENSRVRAGFTLAEVLMAVGILVILMAVAVPSVLTIRAKLKMTELDSYAREIFVASQNRLIALRSNASLGELTGRAVAQGDLPDGQTWEEDRYFYVDQDGAQLLLPPGSIDETVRAGRYVIVYNRATAMVCQVFYAEQDFTYQGNPQLRDRAWRQANYVGYYGGSGVEAGAVDSCPLPDFELLNGEELCVKVNCVGEQGLYTYRVTVEDRQDAGKRAQFEFSDTDMGVTYPNLSYEAKEKCFYLVLDSLQGGMQFQDLCPQITPGADLKVTVEVLPTGGSDSRLPTSAVDYCNSLFAYRETRDDTWAAAAGLDTAEIACARHLQNLDLEFSHLPEGLQAAVQTDTVTWDGKRDFVPIVNQSLVYYDGQGNEIADLNIVQGGTLLRSDLGLFSTFGKGTLREVRLRDVSIRCSTPAGYVGALVGYAQETAVEDCQVFASGADASCHITLWSSVQDVGGLAGRTEDAQITGCSASLLAVTAHSAQAVGGLVGSAAGGGVSGSYADTGSWKDGQWTGGILTSGWACGLIGSASGTAVNQCYALGYLQGGSAAGLLSASGRTTLSGCYSAAQFPQGSTGVSPFASGAVSCTGCYYWEEQSAGKTDGGLTALDWAGMQSCLSGGGWGGATAASAQPYGSQGVYPFPQRLGLRHYGDWPEQRQELGELRLAYYERYGGDDVVGNAYRYYTAPGYQGASALDDLRGGGTVIEDGYAFLIPKDKAANTKLTVAYRTSGGEKTFVFSSQTGTVTIGGVAYYAYRMPPNHEIMRNAVPDGNAWDYYRTLTVDGSNYYFNPYFAKTAVNGASSAPESPDQVCLRTARHLAALGQLGDDDWQRITYWEQTARRYQQERDISFAAYGGAGTNAPSQTLTPIGRGSVAFYGSYDGGGFLITGADISRPGEENVGLFGYLHTGTVENVVFLSDLEGETPRAVTGKTNVGALVGYNLGTVRNCAVAGFQVSGENNVGGFVGQNASGTISGCSAANGNFTGGTLGGWVSGTGTVGGFAGYAAGTIRDCYAVAQMDVKSTTCFGFAGDLRGTAERCYSAAVDAKTGAYLDFGPYWGTKSQCYALGFGTTADQLRTLDLGAAWGSAAYGRTYPYDNTGAYPYPAVVQQGGGKAHYGNWPISDMGNVELGYYEYYSDHSIGFYSRRLGLDSLSDNKTAVQDGYVLLFREDGKNSSGGTPVAQLSQRTSCAWGGGAAQTGVLLRSGDLDSNLSYQGKKLNNQGSFSHGGQQYVPMFLPAGAVVTAPAGSTFYQQLTVANEEGDSRTFWYNPHFAKSEIAVNSEPGAGEITAILRTQRQFAALAAPENRVYWAKGITYLQERSLTFGEKNPYTKTYFGLALTGDGARYRDASGWPIGGTAAPFAAAYNGQDKTLTGLSYTAGDAETSCGVFGRLTGRVERLTLSAVTVTGGQAAGLGALAGAAENAAVSKVTVTDPKITAQRLAGGAVGRMSGGTVEELTVQNGSVEAVRLAGGAIGQVSNGAPVTINGVKVEDTQVKTTDDGAVLKETDTSYGTGGFAGGLALTGPGDVSICDVELQRTTVKTQYQCLGGAVFVGTVYSDRTAGLDLEKITLKNSTLTASGGQRVQDSAYGLLLGHIRGAGPIALSTLTRTGCTLSWEGEGGAPAQACFGGYVGLLSGSDAVQENKKLVLTLPGGRLGGLTLDLSGAGEAAVGGFVGRVAENTVLRGEGLTLTDGRVVGGSGPTGGFVGESAGGISACSVDDVSGVSGGSCTGGFAGRVTLGEITNCDVRLSSWVNRLGAGGGFDGANKVSARGDTGGFAGAISGSGAAVTDCFAAIPVSGEGGGNTGGFAGLVEAGRVERCYSSAQVRGEDGGNTGGFAGLTQRGTAQGTKTVPLLVSCFSSSTVDVDGESGYTGGFVGRSNAGTILSSYSAGTVGTGTIFSSIPAKTGRTGGFLGDGEGLVVRKEGTTDEELNKVLASMVTFYNVLQTTKVVNRDESNAALLPDGSFDTTDCMNVISYLTLRKENNRGMQIDSEVVGDPESRAMGTWTNGKLTGNGAVSWNVIETMKLYPQLQEGVWMATWEDTPDGGEVVVYWCMEELSDQRDRTFKTYKYVNSTGQYYIGETSVKTQREYGAPYYVLYNPQKFTMPIEVPATMTINGCYRYSAADNYNETGAKPGRDPYADFNYVGISRWLDGDFVRELKEHTFLPAMDGAAHTKGYYWQSKDYPYPALPNSGCGVEEYTYWGRWWQVFK